MGNWLGQAAVRGAGVAYPLLMMCVTGGCSGDDSSPAGWSPDVATTGDDGTGTGATPGSEGPLGGTGARGPATGGQAGTGSGEQGGGAEVGGGCDTGLDIDSTDALDAVRAIGLCPEALGGQVVLDSAYTLPDGSGQPKSRYQWALVEHMGPTRPLEGERMLLLSTGIARDEADGLPADCTLDLFDPDVAGQAASASPPTGFPKHAQRPDYCLPYTPNDSEFLLNSAALSLQLRVPQGAVGLRFAANYYTMGFPGGICAGVDASFVALVDPAPPGAIDGNIAYDATGNAIGLGYEMLRVCDPGTYAETYALGGPSSEPHTIECGRGGLDQLQGTGYDYFCAHSGDSLSTDFQSPQPDGRMAGSSTGWLKITAPVTAGTTVSMRFAVWQSINAPFSDRASVLLDDFRWLFGEDVTTTTTEVYPQ